MSSAPLGEAIAGLARELGVARHRLRLCGLRGGAAGFALARLLAAAPRPVLVVAAEGGEAEALAADLGFFVGAGDGATPLDRRVHLMPGWEVSPFEGLSPAREVVAARMEALYHLLQTPRAVVVATVEALAQRLLPRGAFAGAITYLVVGEELRPEVLTSRLAEWGYQRVPLVQDPGEIASRGGIVDVFPTGYRAPLRLDFAGDTVESIRELDAATQRSQAPREEALLLPAQEFPRSRLSAGAARAVDARAAELGLARRARRELVEAVRAGLALPGGEFLLPYLFPALARVGDYLPPDTLLWIVDPAGVEAALEAHWQRACEAAAAAAAAGRFAAPPEALFLPPGEWREMLGDRVAVEVEALLPLEAEAAGEPGGDGRGLRVLSYATGSLGLGVRPGASGGLAPVAARLQAWLREGWRVVAVAATRQRAERLAGLLGAHGLACTVTSAPFASIVADGLRGAAIAVGTLRRGFQLPADGLVVVTEEELLGEPCRVSRARPGRVGELLGSIAELRPGDYVVHVDHGIGLYRGLRHLHVAGTEGDYLHLEYAGGDRLYVPVARINLVQRYLAGDGAAPGLDRLGGASWERVKHRARASVLAMARQLLEIYAARETAERRPLSPPDALYREFEARFPFEPTPDQQQAIDDVLADLERARPMDRLVCGDVGFGKTEVALRAAFLTVLDGAQVAVLVPTTVLAQQHLETFRARFAGYPVSIDVLSRFRSRAENAAVIERLRSGRLDIVIGTHRLLQPDVAFRRLGLLVVDEEHRFGVVDKERIKRLRAEVDVLTLTATPIPRTLHMSLSGIRDLSVIETPPLDRLAVRTYVTPYDEGVIRDGVLRELGRGGQVFFVHNRVETIEAMARRLAELVPEARLAVAHGQMRERVLERVMVDFLQRRTNLLVCSAIVESGLDIPTANTMIVNRADTFGLAQLYQLRGRIGRSHHRAYAYLLIPGRSLITREAQKRLRALEELDDLGGGFRLAAHDLEIRGAGNLLGKQQSGHLRAVGLELYTSMLEQAVRELRGEPARVDLEPEIQLGIPAYIPEDFVPDVSQRLVLYKRLAAIRGLPDLEDIAAEMVDRYGPLPPVVDTLLRVMDVRRYLRDLLAIRARRRGGRILVELHRETSLDPARLLAVVAASGGRARLAGDYQFAYAPAASDHDGVLAELRELLRSLAAPAAQPG